MDPAIRNSKWKEEDNFQKNGKFSEEKLWITTITAGRSGAKLLHYDSDKLLRMGALFTLFCKGTVFNKALFISLLQYIFAFSIGFAIPFLQGQSWEREGGDAEFESELIKSMELITGNLRRPTMFIFGLFTSLTIGRWWAVRVGAVGKVLDAIVHVTTHLTNAVEKKKDLRPEDRDIAEQDIHKVIKLGCASIQCITQISRGDEYMKEALLSMKRDELVTEEEAALLSDCTDTVLLCWAWITTLGINILTRVGLPPPNHNPFLASVQDTSMAITRLQAFHDSQLPFPYVHMMVMLVNVHNLLISFIDGMHLCQVINGMAVAGVSEKQALSAALIVLHLLLVPTMYQGLLHICFLLEDPMGDDITDFPIRSFQVRVYDHCKTILKASHDFWEHRQAEQADRSAAVAAAAAPAAAPAPAPEKKPAPSATTALPALSQLPPEVQKAVEAEIARRFRSDMAKHVFELSASADYLTRRTAVIQRWGTLTNSKS